MVEDVTAEQDAEKAADLVRENAKPPSVAM